MSNSSETNLVSSIITNEGILTDNSVEVLKSYVIDEIRNNYIFQEIWKHKNIQTELRFHFSN